MDHVTGMVFCEKLKIKIFKTFSAAKVLDYIHSSELFIDICSVNS